MLSDSGQAEVNFYDVARSLGSGRQSGCRWVQALLVCCEKQRLVARQDGAIVYVSLPVNQAPAGPDDE